MFLVIGACSTSLADDWPQWLGPKRDGVWRETGILEKFPEGGPKVLLANAGGNGLLRSGGRRRPRLSHRPSLARRRQEFRRTPSARQKVPGNERVLCLDATSGNILWKHEYDCPYEVSYPAGPRTTPVVAGGKVYTLGTMGDLLCLDAENGTVLWSKNFPQDYDARVQLWGFAAHPLLDGDKLICLVGGEESVVVAFHKNTGKEIWQALSAKGAGYCSAHDLRRRRQTAAHHLASGIGELPRSGDREALLVAEVLDAMQTSPFRRRACPATCSWSPRSTTVRCC